MKDATYAPESWENQGMWWTVGPIFRLSICLLLLVNLGSLFGQGAPLVELKLAKDKEQAIRLLQSQQSNFKCAHNVVKSTNYSLRPTVAFTAWAKYKTMVKQGDELRYLIRIRPLGKSDTDWRYYLMRMALSQFSPQFKAYLQRFGVQAAIALTLGEGKYQVETAFFGENSVCLGKLTVEADKRRDSGGAFIPTGAIMTLWEADLESAKLTPEREGELLIVAHLGRARRFRNRLDNFEISVTAQKMLATLESLRFEKVRVVAVCLEQQAIVYEKSGFSASDRRDLVAAMRAVELGTIDFEKIAKPKGHQELIRQVFGSGNPAAVVIVGFTSIFLDKPMDSLLEELKSVGRNIYYLQTRGPGSALDDFFDRLVKKQDGEIYDVYTPNEFQAALKKVRRRLDSRGAKASGHDN
jgi:hypothetical protein